LRRIRVRLQGTSIGAEIRVGGRNAEDGPKDKQGVELFFPGSLNTLITDDKANIVRAGYPMAEKSCPQKIRNGNLLKKTAAQILYLNAHITLKSDTKPCSDTGVFHVL
jgi:hypothetical protein